ncbi:benzoate 4-monooxygenase cytochrome P450 protein [Rutstroemia sp. NJR-2017a BBW]|nr:benzoate 4-monooxygenase cytochrome P450 protein [Rutstroemia sp. NJR-2017a BBW]
MIATPKGYRDIYNSKANVRKAKWYEVWRRNDEDYSALNTTDPQKHMALRKPLNSAFSERSLRSSEPFILKNVDRWIELMLDGEKTKGTTKWATPKNLGGEWVDYLVFDILGDLCFGKSFNTIEPKENPLRQIPHIIGEYLQFMYPVSINSIFPQSRTGTDFLVSDYKLTLSRHVVTPKPVINFYKFLEECVEERKEQEQSLEKENSSNGRKDMFHYLFHAKDSETGGPAFSDSELLATANLLVTAGSDTTATALCSAFFHLTRDQRIYDKLAKEIRETFPAVEDIRSGPTLSNCRYLQAFCLEAMRMSPSGPSELLRQVLPGGYEVDGHWYPASTLIGVPSYSVHYHQETFKDPFVFRPERWISNEELGVSTEDVAALQLAFNPFSIGPGQCPGKNIALLEMYTVLGRTIHACDVRRPVEDTADLGAGRAEYMWGRRNRNQYQVLDAFLALRNGPMIQLRRRSNAQSSPMGND